MGVQERPSCVLEQAAASGRSLVRIMRGDFEEALHIDCFAYNEIPSQDIDDVVSNTT